MAVVLAADGIVKRYGARAVLDGASVSLRAGEAAVLTGPNGAGKTTLLRVLATLERPDAGRLEVAGMDAREDGARARAAVGHAGHEPGLYPALTVRENLAFAAGARGLRPAAADAALAALGLAAVADERAGRLSRGTRQRASLARALLGEPRVLLLDEPWAALDDASRGLLDAALAAALARGAAVLASTHDVALARGLAARRLAVRGGRVEDAP